MREYILIAGEQFGFGYWLSLAVIFLGWPVGIAVGVYLLYRAFKNGRF